MARGKMVSDVEFVTAFAQANSLDDVVSKLGMGKASVQARASKMRTLGVKLPKFVRGASSVDVPSLNAILEKFGKLSTEDEKSGKKRGSK
jgi:hypothetical protein